MLSSFFVHNYKKSLNTLVKPLVSFSLSKFVQQNVQNIDIFLVFKIKSQSVSFNIKLTKLKQNHLFPAILFEKTALFTFLEKIIMFIKFCFV